MTLRRRDTRRPTALNLAVPVKRAVPILASITPLAELVAHELARVNDLILSRTGSEVALIPEVANHLIESGGKRLRPMLTLAAARSAATAATGM